MAIKSFVINAHTIKRKTAKINRMPRQKLNIMLVLFAVFLIGIAIGALASKAGSSVMQGYIGYLARTNIESSQQNGFFSVFFSCAAPYAALLLVYLIFSYCALGLPMILLATLFGGLCSGIVATYLYSYLGSGGILYNLLLLLPVTVAVTVSLFKMCACGIQLSAALFLYAFQGGRRELKPLTSSLAGCAIKAAIVIIVASLYQTALIKVAGGLFIS